MNFEIIRSINGGFIVRPTADIGYNTLLNYAAFSTWGEAASYLEAMFKDQDASKLKAKR